VVQQETSHLFANVTDRSRRTTLLESQADASPSDERARAPIRKLNDAFDRGVNEAERVAPRRERVPTTRLYGPESLWKDVGQRLLDAGGRTRA
jgi:hypothetical protein